MLEFAIVPYMGALWWAPVLKNPFLAKRIGRHAMLAKTPSASGASRACRISPTAHPHSPGRCVCSDCSGRARGVGPHRPTKTRLEPYELGMPPYSDARRRFPVQYYVIAVLFILFDIEVIFSYPWAVMLRQLKLFG